MSLRSRFVRWLGAAEEEDAVDLYDQFIRAFEELAEIEVKLSKLEKDTVEGFKYTLQYIKDDDEFNVKVAKALGFEGQDVSDEVTCDDSSYAEGMYR